MTEGILVISPKHGGYGVMFGNGDCVPLVNGQDIEIYANEKWEKHPVKVGRYGYYVEGIECGVLGRRARIVD